MRAALQAAPTAQQGPRPTRDLAPQGGSEISSPPGKVGELAPREARPSKDASGVEALAVLAGARLLRAYARQHPNELVGVVTDRPSLFSNLMAALTPECGGRPARQPDLLAAIDALANDFAGASLRRGHGLQLLLLSRQEAVYRRLLPTRFLNHGWVPHDLIGRAVQGLGYGLAGVRRFDDVLNGLEREVAEWRLNPPRQRVVWKCLMACEASCQLTCIPPGLPPPPPNRQPRPPPPPPPPAEY